MKHKITAILTVELELDLDNYLDPESNDYPYEDQIADEIVNDLAESDGTWSEILSDATVVVDIST